MTAPPGVLCAAAVSLAALTGCQTPAPAESSSTAAASPAAAQATVTATIDGDTLRVRLQGRTERVRILGINAAEVRHGNAPQQCGGEAARTALDRLVWHKTITLQADPRSDAHDRYGRLLRYVARNGQDVGLQLIQQGRASAWHPVSSATPTRTSTYQAAQQRAEHHHRGQWATCTTTQEEKR